MNLADILKDSNYKLSQFQTAEIEQLEQTIALKATKSGEVPYTVCLVRQKAIKLTPEEAIRQLYLRVLTERLHYPLDAEYYQPKYDELYESLQNACLEKKWELKKLCTLSSLFKYGVSDSLEYREEGIPFLRIADLQKYRFSEKDLKFISQDAAKQYKEIVQTGDVLISRSGTLGIAVVIPEYLRNAIYGSCFILTRPRQELIESNLFSFLSQLINWKTTIWIIKYRCNSN